MLSRIERYKSTFTLQPDPSSQKLGYKFLSTSVDFRSFIVASSNFQYSLSSFFEIGFTYNCISLLLSYQHSVFFGKWLRNAPSPAARPHLIRAVCRTPDLGPSLFPSASNLKVVSIHTRGKTSARHEYKWEELPCWQSDDGPVLWLEEAGTLHVKHIQTIV